MRKLLLILFLLLSLAVGTWLGSMRKLPPLVTGPVMRLHILNVGNGDSALIESPDHKWMLIDSGDKDAGDYVLRYLKSLKVSALEFVVMTHPRSDHVGALPQVLENFPVKYILSTGYPYNSRTTKKIQDLIINKNIPLLIAYKGQQYRLGSRIRIDILSPPQDLFRHTDDDANNNSLVMRVSYKEISALLPGDIKKEAEASLIESHQNIESNILKAAHHAARDSSSVELLRLVRPDFVVVSTGKNGRDGLPSDSTLSRLSPEKLGAQLYRTDQDGTIVLSTDGERVVAETER